MALRRATGSVNKHKIAKVSGTAIAEGDAVKKNGTSSNVTAMTAGAAFLGIACQAGASSSTAEIEVDIFRPGDSFYIDVGSGTPTAGDIKSCDFASATAAAVGTDSSHDMLYMYNGSTSDVLAYPKNCETGSVVS